VAPKARPTFSPGTARSGRLARSRDGGGQEAQRGTPWANAPESDGPGSSPPGSGENDAEGDVLVEERQRTQRPRRYLVVFHNDDYTTMEFVVHVLMKFFKKSETESTHIMLNVHHKGYGVVDVFPRDIAETKASQVMEYARSNGHPLRVSAEPEGDDE
jgi:ATP-dependent Clp protease adaptor protein ClpS